MDWTAFGNLLYVITSAFGLAFFSYWVLKVVFHGKTRVGIELMKLGSNFAGMNYIYLAQSDTNVSAVMLAFSNVPPQKVLTTFGANPLSPKTPSQD